MSAADIDRLYRRFFPLIRQKCRRMLGDFDTAQDLAQDTFVRLWRARLPEQDSRRVTAWIYKTATHLAIDHLRAKSVRDAVPPSDAVAQPPEVGLEARRVLLRVAKDAPRDELECALLARIDGLTQPEAAEVLGVSERTVRRLLERFDARTAHLRGELP
ncbi:MAG: RNA polymerase sigma factor [Myxococcales bacterium]|nr:RNA polymerase sigma factor [Myxococcales bacterium]